MIDLAGRSGPDRGAPFDPAAVDTFCVTGLSFDEATRTVSLRYGLGRSETGPFEETVPFEETAPFEETITFETEPAGDTQVGAPGFERALRTLHVAAGVSYYKAAAPPLVVVEAGQLTPAERRFHHHLYDDGLREFALANGLPVPRPVGIRSDVRGPDAPGRSPPSATVDGIHHGPSGLVVPIGGGKDSLVLIEAVRGLDELRPRLFAVNPHPLVSELADRVGLELIVVRRTLSPNLADLNAAGALNGHVPITAIVSLIAVAGSFIYGYDAIAMAIERSASEETVLVDGVPVNHQYSKSLELERMLGDVSSEIAPGLTYGSALRPYSELAIARTFSRLTDFHSTFCSCNRAFRQTAAPADRWCGHCPKCRFVALMLAPFLGPGQVAAIIGRDLFADIDEIAGFADLMSDAAKPFECVGEKRESAAALRMLSELPDWRDRPVVNQLAERARELVSDQEVEDLLRSDPELSFAVPSVARAVERLLAGRP